MQIAIDAAVTAGAHVSNDLKSAPALALPSQAPHTDDVTAFDNLMDAPSGVEAVGPAGGQLIAPLRDVSESLQQSADAITGTLTKMGDFPSAPQLLQLQLDIAAWTLQVDLMAKGVGKGAQGIEELVKMQ
jgi:type III secretion system YscI/HrpB-like protein